MKQRALFKWGKLSKRQKLVLNWWTKESKYRDYDGIIADGSIRSGKTVSMGFSFIIWAMSTFNGRDKPDRQNFAMCGKTIEAFRRNVWGTLKQQLKARGFLVTEKRSENLIVISKGNTTNLFYLFGGKDEGSQDLIQGITLAGLLCDEVALMPESFVNQATGRCSVDGSKFWFNCNPSNPQHWFYNKWIKKAKSKRLVYLHFTMRDNLTLAQRIRERYEAMYSGVFFQRYILGLWVSAEGLIYKVFDKSKHVLTKEPETVGEYYISSDYGIQNANVFLLWRKIKNSNAWVCLKEWRYSGREEMKQKTVSELADGLETILARTEDGKTIKPDKIIVDPSASALIIELRKRGYKVIKGKNEVLEGIEDVSTMLNTMMLFFMDSCKGTIREFGLYSWDEKMANKGKDVPIKDNDHGMDAVRYFVRTMKLVKHKDDNEEEVSSYFY